MTYPIKVVTPSKFVTKFQAGQWYECVEAKSRYFTEGRAYLCIKSGPQKELCLVDDDYETVLVSLIHTRFFKHEVV